MVGEDQHKIFEGIRQSKAAALEEQQQERRAGLTGPLVLTPHMTRALQRNIIMPHVTRGRGGRGAPLNQDDRDDVSTKRKSKTYLALLVCLLAFVKETFFTKHQRCMPPIPERLPSSNQESQATPPLWLRLLLLPCGYRAQERLWIHDVDLARGAVVIVNHSSWSVDLGRFQLCNEEGRQKFDFPSHGFIVPAHGRVQVHCGAAPPSPMAIRGHGAAAGAGGGGVTNELFLYWQPEQNEPVLAREGDAVYLWDAHGRIVSALAKSGDGSSKRYAPSTAERLHNSFHNLSQVSSQLVQRFVARLMVCRHES